MLACDFARPFRHALLLSFCLVLACLSSVAAQTVRPSTSNVTLPADKQFALIAAHNKIALDPLTPTAGSAGIMLTGRLIATNSYADAANNLKDGDITLISCDASTYPGPLDASKTIEEAVSKNPIAIVLFSSTATQCSFNSSENFTYTSLYTTINPFSLTAVQDYPSEQAKIMLYTRSDNTTSDGSFTKSPTTAVAMIILYSITGIITALFLVIIVVGAIRAHRHPERYGPRHVIGRPRQSRAKGIARAMLETLPIVKFGDKDDKPITSSRDVELGGAGGAHPAGSPPAIGAGATTADGSAHGGEANTEPELVKTETVDGNHESEQRKTEGGTNADSGLACSVCTDDFVKGQDIRVLPCDHKFHPECIDPWLLNVSGTCPLCRVDLRPINSPTDHDLSEAHPHADFDSHEPSLTAIPASSTNNAAAMSTSQTTADPTSPPNRRSRTGLSLYLQSTLNRRHMRDATPEERIQALRTLRTANRARESESGGSTEPRSRNRMSARLSRAFTSSRPPSGVPTTSLPASNSAEVSESDSFAGRWKYEGRRSIYGNGIMVLMRNDFKALSYGDRAAIER
ncbi:hypothetical protein MMC07_005283 [Pseudocyphellaria aurata]|nr:hypothetical protein [Pseudocyphellaria aurata]